MIPYSHAETWLGLFKNKLFLNAKSQMHLFFLMAHIMVLKKAMNSRQFYCVERKEIYCLER